MPIPTLLFATAGVGALLASVSTRAQFRKDVNNKPL
jgi:hypothetical protein